MQWRASTLGSQFVTITACDAESGQLAGVANVAPGLTLAEAEGHLLLGPGEAAATLSNMAVAPQHRRQGLGRLLLATAERVRRGPLGACVGWPLLPRAERRRACGDGRRRRRVAVLSRLPLRHEPLLLPRPLPLQAALALSPPSTLMALAVYRYNDVPVRLYTSAGYQADDAWVDLRWADAAERGRVGVARRQLMLKPLPGAPRPLAQVPRRPAAAAEEGATSK